MKNIILIVLDTVRRDFFYKNLIDGPIELINDFVHFKNCKSIYTATCTSHYTMFFGDYWNRSKNRSFIGQLRDIGYITNSYFNSQIITGYPLKGIFNINISQNRPFREEMIKDLNPAYELDWKRNDFGSKPEDIYGSADDEINDIRAKVNSYLSKISDQNNFLFLHYWNAHYTYKIENDIDIKIIGSTFHEQGMNLIDLVRKGKLSIDDVKRSYSKRVKELISINITNIIDILKKRELYNDSLIILTADHGEGLGDIGNDDLFQIYRLLNKLEKVCYRFKHRAPLLKKIRFPLYKYDYETFFHNLDHDFQREIPFLIKFPDNEFGGIECNKEVTLFDIIHTINDFVDFKMDIRSNNGSSLYQLFKNGEYSVKKEQTKNDDTHELDKHLRDLGYL